MSTRTAIVCDDDRTLVKIMEFVLLKKGFSVRLADNGQVALQLLGEAVPGLMFLDLEMPKKDGLSVLADLQASGAPRPYTIVLSSHESEEIHDKALGFGANEVWVKPFNPAELLKRIEGLIEQGKV